MVKRLIIFLIFIRIAIYLGSYFINYNFQPNFLLHLLSFANQWDSPHYLYIAGHWYQNFGDEANFIVFLPVYPILIKIFSFIFSDYKISALILSNTCFILAEYFFYKLLRLDYDEKFSAFVTILVSIFPTSYFFSSAYPESIFFLLFCLSAYYIRQHDFFKSSISAGVASLTRPFGVMFLPMLITESLVQKIKFKKIIEITAIVTTFYFIYLLINYFIYGNPLAFQTILSNHWGKTFSPPWVGIINSWKVAIQGTTWDSYKIFVGFWEAIFSTLAWLVVPFMFFGKTKIRLSYAVYYFFGVLLFTSTSFLLSSPRYILSLPPFFIVFARILKPKFAKIVWIGVSVVLLFYLTGLFSRGQWAF